MHAKRTLIISGSEKGLDGVTGFLKTCGCGVITIISNGSEARRMIQQDDYELIIINTPLKDEFGHQLSIKLSETTHAGIILICKSDHAEEINSRTIDYGVCVIAKPLNKISLLQAIRLGIASNRRLTALYQENEKLRAKLEEMRYVSRAKFLLITNQDMTEVSAHRYIEKTAMDTRRTKREIALDIIAKYE